MQTEDSKHFRDLGKSSILGYFRVFWGQKWAKNWLKGDLNKILHGRAENICKFSIISLINSERKFANQLEYAIMALSNYIYAKCTGEEKQLARETIKMLELSSF